MGHGAQPYSLTGSKTFKNIHATTLDKAEQLLHFLSMEIRGPDHAKENTDLHNPVFSLHLLISQT